MTAATWVHRDCVVKQSGRSGGPRKCAPPMLKLCLAIPITSLGMLFTYSSSKH